MYKETKWCLVAVLAIYALRHSNQRFIEQNVENVTERCNEVINLSKYVGWRNILRYTLEDDKKRNLSLCRDENSLNGDKYCCPVKNVLTTYMNEHFYHSFSEKLKNVSTVFDLSFKLFNFSFLNLLNHSKFDLHRYLISTNEQQLDEHNFFTDLFWDLEEYFTGLSSANLSDSFLTFFDNLIRQLFLFHFNDFNLEESSLDCISRLSKEIKPFGDAPVTLGNQIKKSFQLVRLFSQSLRQGQEILNILEKVLIPILPCQISMEGMSYCSYCQELDIYPNGQCSNISCINLVQNYCLKGLRTFEKDWLVYVDGLTRFVGCFDQYCNIEDVIRTIEQNVVSSINTFQTTAKQFFHEVSNRCGLLPSNVREKRTLSEFEMAQPTFHPSRLLVEKLKNIKVDIESRKNFIGSLVSEACEDFLLPDLSGRPRDLNCSDVVSGSHLPNSMDFTSKEFHFAQLSQKVKNISERMKNTLSSYKTFVSEKLEATASGSMMYSSGSGVNDGDDDLENDDDDDGSLVDDALFEENGKKVDNLGDERDYAGHQFVASGARQRSVLVTCCVSTLMLIAAVVFIYPAAL